VLYHCNHHVVTQADTTEMTGATHVCAMVPWSVGGVANVAISSGSAPRIQVTRETVRVCIDGKIRTPHAAPSLTGGSSWFSSQDLHSGYLQVPEARPKTAFCMCMGLWQFHVLSFGLCNAPAMFERLMVKVLLPGIPHEECLVYLDDILAHGGSFQSALGAVMGAAEGDSSGYEEFLGHRLEGDGVSTLEEKVHAVRGPPPLICDSLNA